MEDFLKQLEEQKILDKVSMNLTSLFYFEQREALQSLGSYHGQLDVNCSKAVPKSTVKSLKKKFKNLPIQVNVRQSIGLGQNMNEYKGLQKVFSDQEVSLFHKPGEVLLVDVWATWCVPCQQPMSHNQQMLVKNEQQWKDKVRIVAVSVDEDKKVVQKRVNSRCWKKIQHLTLSGWDEKHPLMKDFEIEGIPFVFLVNKQGKIAFSGNPGDIELEEKINELLWEEQKEPVQHKQIPQNTSLPEFLLTQFQSSKLIGSILTTQRFESLCKEYPFFIIEAIQDFEVSNGLIQKRQTKVRVTTDKNTPQLIKEVEKMLEKIDKELYQIETVQVLFQNIPNVQNAQCTDCKTSLSYPFYWCKWDNQENTFRCRSCVEKKPQIEDQYYSYKNNSVLLTGPWSRVYSRQLGNNLQPTGMISEENKNTFGCNVCGACPSKLGQARYVCLICNFDHLEQNQYCDICQECVNLILSGDQQKMKELEAEGHNPNHPLLRVLYRSQDYSKF